MIDLNHIVGAGVIALNLIPFIIKKPKYVFLTAVISLLVLFLLAQLR